MNKQDAVKILRNNVAEWGCAPADEYPIFTDELGHACNLAISALTQQLNNGWIPCSERLPKREEEVFIFTKKGTRTTAIYEDGKTAEDDSCWNWTDVDLIYNEETDESYLPEGWWEYRHFNPDDVYNNCVDEEVVAWQPLPGKYTEVSK